MAKLRHSKKYAWFVAPSPKYATAIDPLPCSASAAPVAAAMLPPTIPKQPISAVVGVDDVHRAGTAAVDARRTPEQLGEERLRLGARARARDRGRGRCTRRGRRPQRAREADRDRLLTRVEMRRAVHLAAEEERLDEILDSRGSAASAGRGHVDLASVPRLGRRSRNGHVLTPSGAASTALAEHELAVDEPSARAVGAADVGRAGDEQLVGREAGEDAGAGRGDDRPLPRSARPSGRPRPGSTSRARRPSRPRARPARRTSAAARSSATRRGRRRARARTGARTRRARRSCPISCAVGQTSAILSVVTPGRTRSIASSSHSRHCL